MLIMVSAIDTDFSFRLPYSLIDATNLWQRPGKSQTLRRSISIGGTLIAYLLLMRTYLP